mgnify:CR=1 FL=1
MLKTDPIDDLSLDYLQQLRLLWVAAQAIGSWGVASLMALPFATIPVAAVLGTQLVVTYVSRLCNQRVCVGSQGVFAILVFDVVALTALLAVTGGANNPLVWLYVVPLTAATVILPSRWAWLLIAVAVTGNGMLIALPVNQAGGDLLQQHVIGMWLMLWLVAALITRFVAPMGRALREARLRRARERYLVALATRASTAVHEIATPLGTLTLLADELANDPSADRQTITDEMRQEIERCRTALDRTLASAGVAQGHDKYSWTARAFLEQAIGEWRGSRTRRPIALDWPAAEGPLLAADDVLIQALNNLLDNADRAAPGTVTLAADWDTSTLRITVADRGPGRRALPTSIEASDGAASQDDPDGLGLGLLLSHSIVEQLGGCIITEDRPDGGLKTHVELPVSVS